MSIGGPRALATAADEAKALIANPSDTAVKVSSITTPVKIKNRMGSGFK